MMGVSEFNSACFYRYANIDLAQLEENLQGDAELARRTVEAFLRVSFEAIPTGKQNSMAAQNPPSLVFAVVRKSGFWSLANAFVRPVSTASQENLVVKSIEALRDHWNRLIKVYGDDGIKLKTCITIEDIDLKDLNPSDNLNGLVQQVLTAISRNGEAKS